MVGSVGRAGVESGRLRAFPNTRRCVLFYCVLTAAVASVASSLMIADGSGVASAGYMLVAVAAFSMSQLARFPLRVGSDVVLLGWGEVGALAVLCLVPAVWVPTAVVAGGILGHANRLIGADAFTRARVLYGMSSIAVAGVVSSGVLLAVGGAPDPVPVRLDRPATFIPILLASFSYFLVTSVLTSAWVASTTHRRLVVVWLKVARAKKIMLAGNVAIGLAVALVIAVHVAWLAILAPVLWFLHQAYANQLRSSHERRIWVVLAEATRRLNQLDERGVVTAALTGSARLFAPDEVELVVQRRSGRRRSYLARASDLNGSTNTGIDGGSGMADSATTEARNVLVRRLLVGDSDLGELRLRFRRRVVLGVTEQHVYSTFAGAVASALHDAATHRQLQAMTARSAYDAIHDPLTGLINRSTLLARGNSELRLAEADRRVGMVVFNVDGLRSVNDTFGYSAGDELRRLLARRLADRQLVGELIGRLGGDEYALLLAGPAPARTAAESWDHAIARAQLMISALSIPAQVRGVTIGVETSAGVVVEEAGRCDVAELLRRADVALHRAKREDARVARYDAPNDAASADRLTLLAEFRDALSTTEQLTLRILPTVDLITGAPLSAEALVRWHHPRRGLLAPGEFIGAVEHSDLAAGLTRHVVEMALRIVAGWATQGVHVPISVNLCARCLVDPELPARIGAMLAAHAVPPNKLIVEITEAVMTTERDAVERVIAGLRAVGVQVSVDDFGTGSASLSFLTRFAVDEVKIDRAFVAAMVDSPETAAIVRATVDLAHELGLRVVAEGVESAAQRAELIAMDVTAAQGFLFHPPLRLDEATAVLQGLAHSATSRTIPIVRAPG